MQAEHQDRAQGRPATRPRGRGWSSSRWSAPRRSSEVHGAGDPPVELGHQVARPGAGLACRGARGRRSPARRRPRGPGGTWRRARRRRSRRPRRRPPAGVAHDASREGALTASIVDGPGGAPGASLGRPTLEEVTMARLEAGQPAPDFSLQADDGSTVSLSDLAGQHGRALLLPEGRHDGLHRRGVRVPRHAGRLRRGRRPGDRGQPRPAEEPREVPRQVRPAVHAAERPGPRRPPRRTACGSRSRCTARRTWASSAARS